MKFISFLALAVFACALPARGQFSIVTPYIGDSVSSPFQISAADATCGGQTVVSMGYSFDSSGQIVTVSGSAIRASASAGIGSHVLHLLAWGASTQCMTDVQFSVTSASAPPPPPPPPSGGGGSGGTGSGGISVSSPAANAQVATQFSLAATSSTCSSANVVSMGYSLDHNANALIVNGQSINTQVTASAGAHVVHVKSWGPGTACVTDVPITVAAGQTSGIPGNALVFSAIDQASNWNARHDEGTPGTAYGQMSMVAYPSVSGNARQFVTTFYNSAGERYSDNFGSATSKHNFLYDGWIYVASPADGLANLELDLNQVVGNGDTIIMSFQCSGNYGVWEYGENIGTRYAPVPHWVLSSIPCDPQQWSTDTWHHIQISESHDDSGNVTYHSVTMDDVQQEIEATVPGAFALGWDPVLQTNLQVDGRGSGTVTVYLDNLAVYAW